jgi:hypothetical protein
MAHDHLSIERLNPSPPALVGPSGRRYRKDFLREKVADDAARRRV